MFPGTPGRDGNFEDKARNFQAHAQRLADTANSVATAGGCRNKQTVEAIFKNSSQVSLCALSVLKYSQNATFNLSLSCVFLWMIASLLAAIRCC